jgi:hypothetical protein
MLTAGQGAQMGTLVIRCECQSELRSDLRPGLRDVAAAEVVVAVTAREPDGLMPGVAV